MSAVSYTQPTLDLANFAQGGSSDSRTSTLDHQKYPLTLTQPEQKAISLAQIQRIVKGQTKAPSVAAGLDQGTLPAVIQSVDDAFRRGVRGYKESLAIAIGKDEREVVELDKQLAKALKDADDRLETALIVGGLLLLGGVAIAASAGAATPGVLTAGAAGGAVGGGGGFLLSDRAKDKVAKALVPTTRHAQSAHRRAWLQNVDSQEAGRTKDVDTALLSRMRCLFKELQSLRRNGETDDRKLEELKAVWKVYTTLFPEKNNLTIQSTRVDRFLTQF